MRTDNKESTSGGGSEISLRCRLTSAGGTTVPPGLQDAEVLTHPFFYSMAAIILRGVYPDDKNP